MRERGGVGVGGGGCWNWNLQVPPGLIAGQAVLELHQELDLLHQGPIQTGVQVLERREPLHGFLLSD